MERRKVAILTPVGPGAEVADTIESIRAYSDPSRAIVLVDNGGDLRERLEAVGAMGDDLHIVVSRPGARNLFGDLWRTVATGLRYCVETIDFDVLLRFDADALMIASGSEDAAIARFRESADEGILGSCRVRFDGEPRDFAPAARMMRAASGLSGLRHPSMRRFLRARLAEVAETDYELGEHPQGAVCFLRPEALQAIYDAGHLGDDLRHAHVCEDFIITLLMRAAGYRVGEFGGPGDPLAIKWRGLPAHPRDLLAQGTAIVHSVRFWQDMDEDEVRAEFARARRAKAAAA